MTPQLRNGSPKAPTTYGPFATQNVTASGLEEESFPDSVFHSTSASDLFSFPADKQTVNWPVSASLDQDLGFSNPVYFQTTFPTSPDVFLEGPTSVTDSLGLPSVISQEQKREDEAQDMNFCVSLPRRRSRYNIQKYGEKTEARPIPIRTQGPNPLQRWHESPPEDEPASMSAIMQAVQMSEDFDIRGIAELPTVATTCSSFQNHRRPISTASSNSGNSASSWHSSGSRKSVSGAQISLATQSHDGSMRIGKNPKSKKSNVPSQRRNFSCTFCCDKFKTKHDWSRHEKTQHLNLGGWMCAPSGGAPLSPITGRRHCAFCSCLDPSSEHLRQHNYTQCSRTFRRKDHLVQHLRLVHRLEILPLIDTWRTPELVVTSRCGFCDCRLGNWNQRTEHLAAHFRDNLTMDKWRGEHDFPAVIAQMVTNSLPPYLIASESNTVVPFSATSPSVRDHFTQISRRANGFNDCGAQLASSFEQLQATEEKPLGTFTEILTQHLGRYARQQMSRGIVPTDEMFQDQARRLLYDSEDSWNQTIADNPEWIDSFRENYSPRFESSESPGTASIGDRTGLPRSGI